MSAVQQATKAKPIPEDMPTLTPHLICAGAAAAIEFTMPVADQFWGDRYGKIEDPFGHHWSIATHILDLSPEEMREAMSKMSGGT